MYGCKYVWYMDSMQVNELPRTRHAVYNLNYHLVWIPRYRRDILNEQVRERLKGIFLEIAEGKSLEILGMEIMPDHIHLFMTGLPAHSPSLLANWFKGISSRLYNHRYKYPKLIWARSYYVGTAGTVTSKTIKRYIEEQKK